ncbi:MAG: VanZ family protein [Candidatus Omnitrophica bacterium]|nr:VanZ family protein [Candidatus Omnitrophota bacterium]
MKSWLIVIMWMAVIFCFSSVPGKNTPSIFPFQDIVFHFFIYAFLGLSFVCALKNSFPRISLPIGITLTVLFGFLYGISDEWHQSFVPGRTVSVFDVLVDTLGSLAAGSGFYTWLR